MIDIFEAVYQEFSYHFLFFLRFLKKKLARHLFLSSEIPNRLCNEIRLDVDIKDYPDSFFLNEDNVIFMIAGIFYREKAKYFPKSSNFFPYPAINFDINLFLDIKSPLFYLIQHILIVITLVSNSSQVKKNEIGHKKRTIDARKRTNRH